MALSIGSTILNACSTTKKTSNGNSVFTTGFTQKPLPYAFNALENVIDAQTMEIHYSKHAAAYTKNMNDAITEINGDVAFKSVEDILPHISKYSIKLRNNAGGHYNHEMFWQCMRPKQADNKPSGKLLESIEKTFTSFADFKKQFADAGKNRFGSGWAWLYADKDKNLKIGSTPNQDNPLMDIAEIKGTPLLALDVWEHAYYLKYQNKRADYIDNWWQVVNWDYVSQRFVRI
ncbi:MAG: superoxide dismutase [Ferruginibacter sp.]|nr:superoxide dismutase [Ferruginibacter sp.]